MTHSKDDLNILIRSCLTKKKCPLRCQIS